MNFSLEVLIPSLFSGAVGGWISYIISIKSNKKSHQVALREEKFGDFTGNINWLRDMIDIVMQSCKMQIVNYKEFGNIQKHRSIDLFNKIYSVSSKCDTLVRNYGAIYNVADFKYNEIEKIHSLLLDVAIRMNYYSEHPKDIDLEFKKLETKYKEAEIKWRKLRTELIAISNSASEMRQKDLS